MSIDRRKAAIFGAAAAVRLLLFTSFPGLPDLLTARVEISTPVTSFKRLQEGVFLYNHNVSPYDGGVYHQAPLLLPLFSLLPSSSTYPTLTYLLYILVDLLSANALMKIAESGVSGCSRLYISPRKDKRWSSLSIAAAFLFNPFTIATCIGRPTSVFTTCAILHAVSKAVVGASMTSMFAIAFASYLSMYPLLLLPPLILLCYDTRRSKPGDSIFGFALGNLVAVGGSIYGLLQMSSVITGSWEFLESTYGIQLLLPDLTPNVGLWWYFFIEMFDSFRNFFLGRPESDSNSDFSSVSPPPRRPNRWEGNSSTYLHLISDERGLASSIDQLQNQNLSIHLYNAHALKRRARQFWVRKERGDVFDEEGEGMGWSPPKAWTAWPMSPDEVPREGEIVREEDEHDLWTLKSLESGKMSGELEEELLAITIREARHRFESREEAGEEAGEDENFDSDKHEPEGFKINTGIKKLSEAPEPKPRLKPIISADDARSADLLRPSIRHNLAQLDMLLMTLHHTRENCHQITSRSDATTDDESVLDEGSPAKRPRGRPRKFANLPLLQKKNPDPTSASDPTSLFRAKKTHIGRPQKVYPRIEGESQENYLIRIARIQKKPLPSFGTLEQISERRSPSAASSKSRKSPVNWATEEESRVSRLKRLGLRDWSEILGAAAMVGFSADVVERATRRCVDLFGEGMTLRTMHETGFRDEDDFSTAYLPDTIPDYGETEGSSESSAAESEIDMSRPGEFNLQARLDTDSWYCPIEVCRRRSQGGYEFVAGLRGHMAKDHGMKKSEIDELLDDEMMDGAVHNDGFLELMRYKRGLRGEGKAKGTKSMKAAMASDDSEDDGGESSGEENRTSSWGSGNEDDERSGEQDVSEP
ncbi:Phosphatidylinositol glycan anchor biosynthesis class U [Hyphodiscus hymeniophilus]|uniref:Phosphatidylinositol glycan anchor biosynthesis class U n=1 Tax=Hyphodiscus hymeniophilus TaxID=353542 RepID=A0A9P6VCG6_9HELO|nr:Phosphatidylinositol glycan anchor biosynthesis class U [Hyphodiscus hymeniophilus]